MNIKEIEEEGCRYCTFVYDPDGYPIADEEGVRLLDCWFDVCNASVVPGTWCEDCPEEVKDHKDTKNINKGEKNIKNTKNMKKRIKLTEKSLMNVISRIVKEQQVHSWDCENGKCVKVVGKGAIGDFATLQDCEESNCEEKPRPGGHGGGGMDSKFMKKNIKESDMTRVIRRALQEDKVLVDSGIVNGNCFCVHLDTETGDYSNETLGGCNTSDCETCCGDAGMTVSPGPSKGPIEHEKGNKSKPSTNEILKMVEKVVGGGGPSTDQTWSCCLVAAECCKPPKGKDRWWVVMHPWG